MKRCAYTAAIFAVMSLICTQFVQAKPGIDAITPTLAENFIRNQFICSKVLIKTAGLQSGYALEGLKNSLVLVYTKNGKGYVHDNIASAVAGIQELGTANQFKVDVSDDPTIFNEANLKKYSLLIFTSTNNDVFDTDEQRVAFRRYIEAGGGFVGVHSVTGTERKWKWFKMMIGETFSWHAKFQKFSVKNIDPGHPSMKGVPAVWERADECYFGKELYPGIKVLMVHDLQTLNTEQSELVVKNAGSFANFYPAVWYQHFEGGNVWITTLGHSKESYQDPVYKNHLLQGIKFIASQFKGLDYAKARAITKDDSLKK